MAVLAAGAVEGDVLAAAGRMVQTRAVLQPDAGSPGRAGRGLRRLRRRPGGPRLARCPNRRPRPRAGRRMTTPRSGPVPVLLAGDEFVLNRLMADELASVAGTGAWALRELEFPWPSVAFGQVAEVDEAAGTEDQMIEALQGVRVCLTQLAPLTTRILDACPDLELFAVSRGGPVNANLDAATAHGVVVTFAPGRNATATAEYTVGMMLAALRGIADGHARGERRSLGGIPLRLRHLRHRARGDDRRARRRGRDRLAGGAHPARLRRARAGVRPLRRARLPPPRRDERGAGRAAVVRAGGVAARAGHPGEPEHDRSGAARGDAARSGAGQLRSRGARRPRRAGRRAVRRAPLRRRPRRVRRGAAARRPPAAPRSERGDDPAPGRGEQAGRGKRVPDGRRGGRPLPPWRAAPPLRQPGRLGGARAQRRPRDDAPPHPPRGDGVAQGEPLRGHQ